MSNKETQSGNISERKKKKKKKKKKKLPGVLGWGDASNYGAVGSGTGFDGGGGLGEALLRAYIREVVEQNAD